MLWFLPAPILGLLSFLLFAIDLCFWASLFFIAAIVRALVPVRGWRRFWLRTMERIGEGFLDGNDIIFWLTQRIEWDVQGVEALDRRQWYLVIANHQTWVDISVLVRVFKRRIPFPRFFIKQELLWVPVIGQAVWAFDMPLMKRYSREFLMKHPELRGRDMETTRKACERYRDSPVTILNFVEGTRFTEAKHKAQDSPYRHLLVPKAGGVGFVLGAMEPMLGAVLDATIVYPRGRPTFWDLLRGRVHKITVRVESIPVPRGLVTGNYVDDAQSRTRVQEWISERWRRKDELIADLLETEQMAKQTSGGALKRTTKSAA